MKGKVEQLEVDDVHHGYEEYKKKAFTRENRLDLNVLLKRIEDRKKGDKKTNAMIFSGVIFLVVIAVLLVAIVQN